MLAAGYGFGVRTGSYVVRLKAWSLDETKGVAGLPDSGRWARDVAGGRRKLRGEI